MTHFVYILYSKEIDSYYIGETEDLERRLSEHCNHYFEEAQTVRASDWKIMVSISCKSRIQARRIESHIKRIKSRVYLVNLSWYPEIS